MRTAVKALILREQLLLWGLQLRLSAVGKRASEVKGALSNRRGRAGHTLLVTKGRPQRYRVLSVHLCVLPFLSFPLHQVSFPGNL